MSIARDFAHRAQTAFNTRDEAGLRALWTDDFSFEGPNAAFQGVEAMIAQERSLWEAFPDVQAEVNVVCAEGDVSVQESVMRGTHTGPLRLGATTVPASGRPVELRISVHLRFRDGRACAERAYLDQLGLLQQLGVLPAAA